MHSFKVGDYVSNPSFPDKKYRVTRISFEKPDEIEIERCDPETYGTMLIGWVYAKHYRLMYKSETEMFAVGTLVRFKDTCIKYVVTLIDPTAKKIKVRSLLNSEEYSEWYDSADFELACDELVNRNGYKFKVGSRVFVLGNIGSFYTVRSLDTTRMTMTVVRESDGSVFPQESPEYYVPVEDPSRKELRNLLGETLKVGTAVYRYGDITTTGTVTQVRVFDREIDVNVNQFMGQPCAREYVRQPPESWVINRDPPSKSATQRTRVESNNQAQSEPTSGDQSKMKTIGEAAKRNKSDEFAQTLSNTRVGTAVAAALAAQKKAQDEKLGKELLDLLGRNDDVKERLIETIRECRRSEAEAKAKLTNLDNAFKYGEETGNFAPLATLCGTAPYAMGLDAEADKELLSVPKNWKPKDEKAEKNSK